jgi:hypothetical protein
MSTCRDCEKRFIAPDPREANAWDDLTLCPMCQLKRAEKGEYENQYRKD